MSLVLDIILRVAVCLHSHARVVSVTAQYSVGSVPF